ncbi:hypothetical protein NDU88_002534 [Pleurodeles waltl]|uniref:Uncharacterized protein n=1 Tax=Pleurodeles waltl TaxID=8319 RepID=A0AAV7VAT2_PLEWA|nr:hypothetical protein NDU88_002534 [Pleurodeles waltl]
MPHSLGLPRRPSKINFSRPANTATLFFKLCRGRRADSTYSAIGKEQKIVPDTRTEECNGKTEGSSPAYRVPLALLPLHGTQKQ